MKSILAAFATVLTLGLIPSLLVILNDFRCMVYRWRHGVWPSREAVEPASMRKVDLLSEKPA